MIIILFHFYIRFSAGRTFVLIVVYVFLLEKHSFAQTCNSDKTAITIIVETMMSYEINYRLMDVSSKRIL
ncbi:hypothetical protein ANTRET_LOCUS7220 [Anthophora retusa]